VLGRYYDRYGLPQALYPDQDSIYQVNHAQSVVNAAESEPGAPRPLTQFGRFIR